MMIMMMMMQANVTAYYSAAAVARTCLYTTVAVIAFSFLFCLLPSFILAFPFTKSMVGARRSQRQMALLMPYGFYANAAWLKTFFFFSLIINQTVIVVLRQATDHDKFMLVVVRGTKRQEFYRLIESWIKREMKEGWTDEGKKRDKRTKHKWQKKEKRK